MRLFFDARYIRFPNHDGISRYSAELGRELVEAGVDVTFIISDYRQLGQLPEGIAHVRLGDPTSILEPLVALRLNRHKPDVVFSPMQTMGSFGKRYRLILTIHDLIYYTYRTPPRFLSLPVRIGWRIYHLSYFPERFVLRGAEALVTVSETTRGLMKQHRLDVRPTFVVPNASRFEPALPKPTKKTLVYMGAFIGYKNVETLIDGLANLPGYTLHLLSKIDPDREAQLTAQVPEGAHVVFEHGASDERYHELLSEATALVTASKAEGFGIPILEAMRAGTPVVASDIPIFREIADDAALYFDADDPKRFSDQVRSLESRPVRSDMVARGHARASRYSWHDSAHRLLQTAKGLSQGPDTL